MVELYHNLVFICVWTFILNLIKRGGPVFIENNKIRPIKKMIFYFKCGGPWYSCLMRVQGGWLSIVAFSTDHFVTISVILFKSEKVDPSARY